MGITSSYTSKNIKVLKGLEAVRLRPAMYIGNTNISGLHHLIWEIFDNSIDEVFAGFCNTITVTLLKNNYVSIQDNGRGIPVDLFENTNKSTLEVILTTLHSGGKFNNNSYKLSGGLHGVGSSVVNALSNDFQVEVFRNLNIYQQQYQKGKPITKMVTTSNNKMVPNGTKITFTPDKEIFFDAQFDSEIIKQKLKQSAFLHEKLKINFINEIINEKTYYQFENGIVDFLDTLIEKEEKIFEKNFYFTINEDNIYIKIIFCYATSKQSRIISFCNGIRTTEGGVHEEGFKSSLLKIVNFYIKKNSLGIKYPITNTDIIDGLFAIINVNLYNPQFEGQTKTKVTNREVRTKVFHFIYKSMFKFLNENPNEAKKLIIYLQNCSKSRIASIKAKTKIKEGINLGRIILPGKLSDCTSKILEEREIFIVEGDSAGGSAKLARNRFVQAILPLRGKIINVQKEKNERIIKNEIVTALKQAIGVKIHNNEEEDQNYQSKKLDIEQLDNLRYNKIILMSDADVDGSHIRILLLTFFFNKMPALIHYGKIYIAQPPLYRIKFAKNIEKYVFSDHDLAKIRNNKKIIIKSIKRYKGLGEMNPDELWETTMDPRMRKLLQVSIYDFANTTDLFMKLMGAKGASDRKKMIFENCNFNSYEASNT